MSCLADCGDNRVGAGAAPPTVELPTPLLFERSASTASHTSTALLQQSFFDPQPRRTPLPYQRSDSIASVSPVTASAPQRTTTSRQPPSMHNQLRLLRRPSKEFFEDEGEDRRGQEAARPSLLPQARCGRDTASAPPRSGAKQHHQVQASESVPPSVAPSHERAAAQELGEVRAVACRTPTSLPSIRSPVPRLPPAPVSTTGEEGLGQKRDVASERHPKSASSFEALSCAATRAGTAAPPFLERYTASSNAYLRAAALEFAEAELPEARGMTGDIWERASKSTVASRCYPQDVPLEPAAGMQVPPKLMRPAPTAAQHTRAPTSSPAVGPPLPALMTSSVSFTNARASTPPIRGIPLFAAMHRPAGVASVSPLSSASSLRLSLAEYGRLQLQDEAVRWYHRCGALERQLIKVQDAFNRQSRLLAAQWRSDGGNGACAKASADAARASSVEAAAAAVTARSPSRRAAELTSRSPDTLLRAYAYAETEGTYCTEQTERRCQRDGSDASPPCPSEGRKRMRVDDMTTPHEPVLGGLGECGVQYRVPKASRASAEDKDTAHDLPPHNFGSPVRRGLTGADDTKASSTLPLLRVSVGLQTDGLGSGNASFARETRGISVAGLLSTFDEATREDPPRLPSVPSSSAMMSKQYVAAMEEMERLRVRLDEAERKSAALQEVCAAKDLQCDDLETQLLGKEEQLLRFQQREQEPTAPLFSDGSSMQLEVAAKALLSAKLSPLIAQVRDLLTLVHPESDSAQSELSALVATERGVAQATAAEGTFGTAFDDSAAACSTNSSPKSPHAETSTHPDCSAALLASLIAQVRSVLISFSRRLAALEAELDVVRADRNELIGEQSEQVRVLQEQLLEKDTAQWKLLEELHRTREQLAASAAQPPLAPADGAADSRESAALRHPQEREEKGEEDVPAAASGGTAELRSFPVCKAVTDATQRLSPQRARTAARPAQTADTSAAEVSALREQLAQVRAAAVAGQEAQRRVLSERLEQAELLLKETRLRAEDEYDRMSGSIEALTRELMDTREALRVKEVSLRIALRESFSPPLQITKKGERSASDGAAADAPVAEGLAQAATSLTAVSPARLLCTTSCGSAASSSSPKLERESARTSTSPSPPVPPHLQSAAGAEKASGVTDTNKSDGGLGPALGAKAKADPRVDADGMLRTLLSAVLVNGEAVEEGPGRTGHSSLPSASAPATANTGAAAKTSSREKSSRGLTVSMGGGSQDATSLTRGRSDGSVAMLGQAGAVEEAVPWEETPPRPPPWCGAHASHATQEGKVETVAVEEQRSICSSPPRSLQRKSVPARLTGTASEEELPLPPPLRSPLFRAAASSASPSPEQQQQQRTPEPHPQEPTRGARLGIYASASKKREQHVPRSRSSELPAQALSTEKLRQFLSKLSAATSPFEAMKESGQPSPANRATFTRWPTPRSTIDAQPAPNHVQPRDVVDAALPTAGSRALPIVNRNEATPGRTPLSLYSASASASPVPSSAASLPSSTLLSRSPHSIEVAARHVQASLSRHREAWQQQELILHSLLASPSL
ncbi:hypothetical protein JIQ42_05918 [Leishmania sp. Namibia]|uniref:hypothetical protein n=1 Tax=Leishmania sp. Namibia TaxID=2802991 RepID=UPI001B4449AE|nr:hypothetical protein JIQ42_05918 [Leishmania sp. Namibia]